jgi:hypothetical protein
MYPAAALTIRRIVFFPWSVLHRDVFSIVARSSSRSD